MSCFHLQAVFRLQTTFLIALSVLAIGPIKGLAQGNLGSVLEGLNVDKFYQLYKVCLASVLGRARH